jgi:glutamyl-tRNA reductase
MSHVDGIFVYDIDDLQQVVEANVSDRGREAQRAEMLIEEEVARFRHRMQSLDAVPTIIALQERVEQIRQAEIERLRSKLGVLTSDQQSAVEALTRSIVNKILHKPISALKDVSGSDQLTTTAELLRSLFGIDDSAVHRNGTASLFKKSRDGLASITEAPSASSTDASETEVAALHKPSTRR